MSQINGENNSVVATVALGSGSSPDAIAVNQVTGTIYVANSGNNNVSVINGSTNAITATVGTGNSPDAIAINQITNRIYVANAASGSLTVVNGSNNATSTVSTGTDPVAVAIDVATNQIYVANETSSTVTVVDGGSGFATDTLSVGTSPRAIAVNPVTNQIYVANNGSANVSVIDGATNAVTSIGTGTGTTPVAIGINVLTNTIYVVNSGGTVSVIDGASQSLTTAVSVGSSPDAITVNQNTNEIYVANGTSGNVTVINGANNSTSTVSAGSDPYAIYVNSASDQIYVANYSGNTLTIIDGANNSAVATVSTGSSPNAIAVNRTNGQIYISNAASNNVTVISPATTASIPLTAAISPVSDTQTVSTSPVFRTTNTTPSFTISSDSIYTSSSVYSSLSGASNPPPTAVYYQLDGLNGNWSNAAMTSAAGSNPASFTITLPSAQSLGEHILYAYATYGHEGSLENGGNGYASSPDISNIQSLMFNVEPLATTTAISTDATPVGSAYNVNYGSPVSFTATVTTSVSGSSVSLGQVAFYDGTTQLGTVNLSTGSTFQTSSLTLGSHNISIVYEAEGYPQYLNSTSSTIVLNVTYPTTTTLSAPSPASGSYGTSVTLAATVTYSGGAVTTGSVTFLNNGSSIGTGTVNSSGVATMTTSTLPVGSDSITASYGATTDYAGSTSTARSVVISAAPSTGQSITVLLGESSLTVVPGSLVTDAMTITPVGGYTGTLQFSCSGLPQQSTCSFQPSTIVMNGSTSQNVTLTIQTTASGSVAAVDPINPGKSSKFPVIPATVFLMPSSILAAIAGRKRKCSLRVLSNSALLILLGSVMAITACGGGSGSIAPTSPATPPGTSTVQIMITGTGNLSQSANVSLTVQ